MSKIFHQLQQVRIPRSYFRRPKRHLATMKTGLIYPLYSEFLMPGDLVKIRCNSVIRQLPTISPSYSAYTMTKRWFVVSIRNIYKDFYRFLSGFKAYSKQTPFLEPLPEWKPSTAKKTASGTLWDFLNYPINCVPDKDSLPLDFKRRAYNYIIDQYFLNQTAQDSILDDGDPEKSTNEDLWRVNWPRDYFTTVLPIQQLGEPVGFPVTGNTKAVFNGGDYFDLATNIVYPDREVKISRSLQSNGREISFGFVSKNVGSGEITSVDAANISKDLLAYLNNNTVVLDNLSSVLISQMRAAFAYQTYGEILAQGGIRDNEVLLSFFGIAPSDEALGRPYYLGVDRTNVITSEVLQTAPTDTQPLGTLGGHGMGVSRSREIRYHAKEYCVIMCLGYFIPDSFYTQGMPREDTLKSKYDWGQPVFQHLSEQPVYAREILCASEQKIREDYSSAGDDTTAKGYNSKIFGYRPYADFWREDFNTCSGLFHMEQFWTDANNVKQVANLSHWSEARFFSIKDGERPAFNSDFLQCKPDNRNYAVQDEDNFVCSFDFDCRYWRPLDAFGTPGRLDHRN